MENKMNDEKIEALARQAGFVGKNLDKTVFGTLHADALANFAELIIKECVGVVDQKLYCNRSPLTDAIKQHFGVE
jgi:hypothetical protein